MDTALEDTELPSVRLKIAAERLWRHCRGIPINERVVEIVAIASNHAIMVLKKGAER